MADRMRSPIQDVITGNTEDVRRCVEWLKEVDRQLKWLAGDLQNQMDAETLCSQSHDLTLHSVRQRAEDVAGLLGDEQKLACVTENVHARILPPLPGLRECCHILTGECGVWIESGEASTSWGASVDGFIAASSWFRRESKDLFEVLVACLAVGKRTTHKTWNKNDNEHPVVAESKSGRVTLFAPDESPVVDGVKLPPLAEARYGIVLSLVKAHDGMTKDQLELHGSRRMLASVRDSHKKWGEVIVFPGKNHNGGYRIL